MENEIIEEDLAEVYTFARPVTFEGNTVETLTIDFDKLTGCGYSCL